MSVTTRVGQTYGDYEILALLGQGGMGEVYRGRQKSLDRPVAIKFISQNKYHDELNRKRFLREIRACSALQHPNIIKIYDYGEHQSDVYLVMELLEGEPFEHYIDKAPRGLPRDFVLKVAEDILSALDHMHPQGYVHRDIKPANVFLTRFNRAVMMDFGLVKIGGDIQLTQNGKMVGTPRYLPPEVLAGRVADHRGDLYQVALVMVEALIGSHPYRQRDMLAYLRGRAPAPPFVVADLAERFDEPLVRFLENALAIDEDLRYQDAPTMLAELARVREGRKVEIGSRRRPPGFADVLGPAGVPARLEERFRFQRFTSKDPLITLVQAHDQVRKGPVDMVFLSPNLRRSLKDQRILVKDLTRLTQIESPHLLTPVEMGREGEHLYLVYPRLRLPTFNEFLQIQHTYPAAVVAAFAQQLCEGFCELHQAGAAHGYLGPSTLLIAPEGRVILTGLEYGPLTACTRLGERGQGPIGPSFFTAPELLDGGPATPAADLFSLGALGYRMLTGSFAEPWGPATAVGSGSPWPPPAASPLEDLFLRCLARHPESRTRDLDELSRRLAGFASGTGPLAAVAAALGTRPDQRSRRIERPLSLEDPPRPGAFFRNGAVVAAAFMAFLSLMLLTRLRTGPGAPRDLDVRHQDRVVHIRWESEQPYPTRIEIGRDARSLEVIEASDPDPTREHHLKIRHLEPDRRYVFRIVYPTDERSLFYPVDPAPR